MNMLLEKSRLATSYRRPFFVFFCTAGLLVIASMLLSSCGGNATAALTSTAAQSTVAGKNISIPIKVYFSKSPESTQKDLTTVFPVDRISPTTGVAAYSIQLLIAGPTTEERDAGYYSLLNSMFSGP